ncbi:MAG: hypothetical protein IPP12_22245 [Nitrospira sp.]|nr:hypothetical protein [Nitrospira sp.]
MAQLIQEAKVQIGVFVEDVVTGFRGTVTGIVHYITGCEALVAPRGLNSDGKIRDSQWFDVQRLVVDAKVARIVLDNSVTPGFDKAAPKR